MPNQNYSSGYPRKFYGGIITNITNEGGYVISVEKFFALSNIESNILHFLRTKAIPSGSKMLKIKQWKRYLTSEQEMKVFEKEIIYSQKSSQETRLKRLENAEQIPQKKRVLSSVFSRNPDVVAETLHRANGICTDCGNEGPFISKLDGKPFLEVHHIIRLADGGEDTLDNTVALCPNCHRKQHYGL